MRFKILNIEKCLSSNLEFCEIFCEVNSDEKNKLNVTLNIKQENDIENISVIYNSFHGHKIFNFFLYHKKKL